MEKHSLSVIDFFCGGGGFSEGFRQAGFNVIWAVDIWQPAVDTHKGNHPHTETIKGDIIALSRLPDDAFDRMVPDAEIIIGSPPCNAFSNSNKSGYGDKTKGIALFEAYLRIVARKKFKKDSILKYWILENVPKVDQHIQYQYTAQELELEGDFTLVVKGGNTGIYNAKYFGVPSRRERFFCGEFPKPVPVFEQERELIPLKTILDALGSPKARLNQQITDPLYQFSLQGAAVADHHYIQEVAEFEWKKARQLKQDKGYMGRMSFPENIHKPARTIMATMSVSARESFILENGPNSYRIPTIREIACLMSFPIDYRFYGSSSFNKYKLVGNAVPPKMAFALAKAIAACEQLPVATHYTPIQHAPEIPFVNLNLDTFEKNIERTKKLTARFKYHIPYFIFQSYRVELTNRNSDFDNLQFNWDAEIHYSQGKSARVYAFSPDVLELSREDVWMVRDFVSSIRPRLQSFIAFQQTYCLTQEERSRQLLLGPYELLDAIKHFLDVHAAFTDEDVVEVDDTSLAVLPRPVAIGYAILHGCVEYMRTLTPTLNHKDSLNHENTKAQIV